MKPIPMPKSSEYQIYPYRSVRGHYSVATPGTQPVFVDGAYHWPKEKAESIAAQLNKVFESVKAPV